MRSNCGTRITGHQHRRRRACTANPARQRESHQFYLGAGASYQSIRSRDCARARCARYPEVRSELCPRSQPRWRPPRRDLCLALHGSPFRGGILSEQGRWRLVVSRSVSWLAFAYVRAILRCRSSIGAIKISIVAAPPFPFGSCGNCPAAAQLRAANDEERRFHRWTQARKFGRRKLTKCDRLGIVVLHDAVPCSLLIGAA